MITDPLHDLAHDHAHLTRRVFALSTCIEALRRSDGPTTASVLGDLLEELREPLFLHFVREEEGLFPFVAELASELAHRVQAMATAHDAICGALARMCQLAAIDAPLASLVGVFERFEAAYAEHARTEATFLHELESRLDDAQRRRLAELVRGL
jgi:iron-sulfur cluster repair protein YtfE (RIC family)